MQSEKQNTSTELTLNNNLPTLFVDGVRVYRRRDGISLIRFTSNLPEGKTEQVRIIVDNNDLLKILDALCRNSNYYPNKSDTNEQSKNNT